MFDPYLPSHREKVFNIANLSGHGGNLLGAGFGQPTSRVTQVFVLLPIYVSLTLFVFLFFFPLFFLLLFFLFFILVFVFFLFFLLIGQLLEFLGIFGCLRRKQTENHIGCHLAPPTIGSSFGLLKKSF